MQRRAFFQILPASAAIALGQPPFDPTAGTGVLLLQTHVAGSHYCGLAAVRSELHPGQKLRLRREQTNPHDQRAVEVLWNDIKLGYLPRIDNAVIAQLLDRGAPLHASVSGLLDPKQAWEPLLIDVHLQSGTQCARFADQCAAPVIDSTAILRVG